MCHSICFSHLGSHGPNWTHRSPNVSVISVFYFIILVIIFIINLCLVLVLFWFTFAPSHV